MDEDHLIGLLTRQSRWWSDTDGPEDSSSPLSYRKHGYWEFLLAAALARGVDWNPQMTGGTRRRIRNEIAGTGATSLVEKAKLRDKTVAVKINHAASQALGQMQPGEFEHYLSQAAKELRILNHDKLKDNDYILDIFACGIDAQDGSLACYLITEYSELGDLRHFLRSTSSITLAQRLGLCLDVAQGLQSLHGQSICHGDVKLENALVFPGINDCQWRVKLCDFSHAYIGNGSLSERAVELTIGTRILCAPELHWTDSSLTKVSTSLEAMRTDVFSYGLLVWEAVKHGESFFDDGWQSFRKRTGHGSTIDDREDFLLGLNDGDLGKLAVKSLNTLIPTGSEFSDVGREIISRTLSYNPHSRPMIGHIVTLLTERCCVRAFEGCTSLKGTDDIEPSPQFPPIMQETSLREIFRISLNNLFDSDGLPLAFQRGVVADLEAIVDDPDYSSLKQSDAAFLLSECYMYGLGVNNDPVKMLQWLRRAMHLDCRKASAWYERINAASINDPPEENSKISDCQDFEQRWRDLPVEGYLVARIHFFQSLERRALSQKYSPILSQTPKRETLTDSTFTLRTFNEKCIDGLSLLHAAAFGNYKQFEALLAQNISEKSSNTELGRNVLFYACLGGNIDVLRCLCKTRPIAPHDDCLGVNPLHLCVFFDPAYVEEAVERLLRAGAKIESSSRKILWEDHDIDLQGTPLEWAVCCRYQRLVEVLIESGADNKGLGVAVKSFFYEIVDSMLSQDNSDEQKMECFSAVDATERPFGNMIAHGANHLRAVSRTFDVLEQHRVPLNKIYLEHIYEQRLVSFRSPHKWVKSKLQYVVARLRRAFSDSSFIPMPLSAYNYSTLLRRLLVQALTPIDFEIACQLINRGGNVKFREDNGYDALEVALSRSRSNDCWGPLLEQLLEYYSIRELAKRNFSSENSYLEHAVTSTSVVGVKALIHKGVDISLSPKDYMGCSLLITVARGNDAVEMLNLLLAHGARSEGPGQVERSPLDASLGGLLHTSRTVDALLGHSSLSEEYVEALHRSFHREVLLPRMDHLASFRYLIASTPIRQILDNPSSSKSSPLLHQASAILHPHLVQLLVEAGADVTKATSTEYGDLDPLQIALENAKWYGHIEMINTSNRLVELGKSNAFHIICMLLDKHVAHKESGFQNIGRLHLAAYTENLDMVKKLLALKPDEKYRHGHWPGVGGCVKPYDLVGNSIGFINLYDPSPLDRIETSIAEKLREVKPLLQRDEIWEKDPSSLQDVHIKKPTGDGKSIEIMVSPKRRREAVITIRDLLKVD